MHNKRLLELSGRLLVNQALTRDEQGEIVSALIAANANARQQTVAQTDQIGQLAEVSAALGVCLARMGGEVMIPRDEVKLLRGRATEIHSHPDGTVHARLVALDKVSPDAVLVTVDMPRVSKEAS